MTRKFSNCCGAEPITDPITGMSSDDIEFCPRCWKRCEYVEHCDDCGELIKECTCDDSRADSLIAKNGLWQIENNAEDK